MKKVNERILPVICVLVTFITAGILLWVNHHTAMQSMGVLYPQIFFQGEYKIGNGKWQEYQPEVHLSAGRGDITLKGTLQKKFPKLGEDLGSISYGDVIAFYCDHLMVEICREGEAPVRLESEIPQYEITCAKVWTPYFYDGEADREIEIRIHNPHKFGNENAVDEMLNNMYIYAGYDFEEDRIEEGGLQRILGMMILLSACCMFGISVFAGRIHIHGNRFFGMVALLMMFAGGYIVLSSPNVNLWKPSYTFNTIALGICMMMYQYLVTWLVTFALGTKTQKEAQILVHLSGAIPAILLLTSIVVDMHFYGTWGIWVLLESLVCLILLCCVWFDFKEGEYQSKTIQAAVMAPLLSFVLDTLATAVGWWQGGKTSALVFWIHFLAVFVIVVRVIPEKINEAARAKELEEKQRELQQELKDRRVSVMMSQIRTHFIFNVMTIISGLCNIDPKKADDALILFARYLRKNIAIMDRDEPILFSQELQHLEDYISLEKLRFRDKICFEKHLEIIDFKIPPLTIQPLVENAIKHGLLIPGKKGTVKLITVEEGDDVRIIIEDDGVGFESMNLEREDAVGIRNVRYRVENMMGGTLELISIPDQGTRAEVCLPRQYQLKSKK